MTVIFILFRFLNYFFQLNVQDQLGLKTFLTANWTKKKKKKKQNNREENNQQGNVLTFGLDLFYNIYTFLDLIKNKIAIPHILHITSN